MLHLAEKVFTLVKFANSIYPTNMYKYQIRELAQKMAGAMCWSLLGHYQEVFRLLDIDDDRYTNDISHLKKMIGLIKNWGKADRKRYSKEKWWNVDEEQSTNEKLDEIFKIINISQILR